MSRVMNACSPDHCKSERDGGYSEGGRGDGDDGFGDGSGSTGPVCVGADDTTRTVAKSLS